MSATKQIAVFRPGLYQIRMSHYLAVDLGAESGRVMLGTLADGCLALEEIHRFPNVPIRDGESMYWDVPRLRADVLEGLKKAGARELPIQSVSCDSWGLDCVLLDRAGELIEPAFHYRDPRTAEGVKRVFSKVPWNDVFAETGIQFMPINALYHLAMETPVRLARTRQIVPIGDVFNYFLCGVARAEVSMASTTQLYNPTTRSWSGNVLAAVDLTPNMFPDVVSSGTLLAKLKPGLAMETGLGAIDVIAGCTHDTASAVAAVPAVNSQPPTLNSPQWAFLSSGTWSLMGVEISEPLINEECRDLNFTNEIGFGGSVRLLKNIVGLWLVQECRRQWAEDGEALGYAALTGMAARAPAFASLINPDDGRFMAPGDMPTRIAVFCRETGQPDPDSPGAFVRCCLESLALLYRVTLKRIEKLTGGKIERLHVVGGGSRNDLLNQFTANACGIPVLAGPAEATALGNILVQAIAGGDLPDLAAGREVIRNSFEVKTFEPRQEVEWHKASRRFDELIE